VGLKKKITEVLPRAIVKLFELQALMVLTEMLRDQRGAKMRSFVLPAVGEMLCLIASQVCML